MKKLLLICATVVAAVSAYGQGAVSFANTTGTRFTTNNGAGITGNMTGLNTYRIGLYTAPAGTVNESLFTLIATATNQSAAPFAGLFSYPVSPYVISGNNGTPIAYQVKAWSLSSGASYEAAVALGAGYGGKSAIGAVTPATGTTPPPNLFGPGGATPDFAGQLNSGVVMFPLAVIPEPSSIALGLLGLGAIALFRRRK
jgi:hypothetical protein